MIIFFINMMMMMFIFFFIVFVVRVFLRSIFATRVCSPADGWAVGVADRQQAVRAPRHHHEDDEGQHLVQEEW